MKGFQIESGLLLLMLAHGLDQLVSGRVTQRYRRRHRVPGQLAVRLLPVECQFLDHQVGRFGDTHTAGVYADIDDDAQRAP